MAIQRWDPLREMSEVQHRINRLFDDAFSRSTGQDATDPGGQPAWKPSTDLIEEGDRYLLRADLPGVAASDVEVRIEDGTLHLRGERKTDAGIPRESYLRVERPHGRFEVKVSLAPSVDAAAVKATHRNGVIEVVLPKRRADEPSRVEIVSG